MKLKRVMAMLLLLPGVMTATAAAPSGYYDDLEGRKGVNLRKAAKGIVGDHTKISYGTSTWEAFLTTDTRIVNGVRCWWDLYSNNNVPAPNASSHGSMNIEHSCARSWWDGSKGGYAYCDLFNLNPSDQSANSSKGNFPFAEIAGNPTYTNGVTRVGVPKSGQGGGSNRCFEPIDEYKGDFARGVFYMFTVYDDENWQNSTAWMYTVGSEELLQPWAVEMLLRWSAEDPVSEREIERNDAVYACQHNRNPYIDLPGLEQYVWGNLKNTAFSLSGIEYPDPTPDPTPDPEPTPEPTPEPNPVYDGEWLKVTASNHINTVDDYVIVSSKKNVFMSSDAASNGKSFTASETATIKLSSSGTEYLESVPTDAAVIKFVKTGSGYVLSVYEGYAGTHKGYMQSETAKTVKYVESLSDATPVTLTVSGGTVEIDFGVAGNLLYNPSSPRFCTYTSNQEPLMLFRQQKETTSVTQLPEAGAGMTRVYTLQGVKVAEGEGEEVLSNLPAGIYVVVKDDKAVKLSVR